MAQVTPFEYCSTEVLGAFNELGTQTLLGVLQAPIETTDLFSSPASTVFTEILMAVDEQLLEPGAAADFLKTAISTEDLAKKFCQVYDVYPKTDNTIQILKSLMESGSNLIHTVMATFIDSTKLIEIGLLSADTFTRQLNTKKRDRFYTQKKFNLLHEEFEGYLLIISRLEDILSLPNNRDSVEYAVKVVNLLIGHYLLDPNRVLDILLYIFSNLLIGNHDFIISFLKKSLWWPKTEACSGSGLDDLNVGGCLAASNSIVLQLKKFPGPELPETFKILVSILIKEGFISFGSIYPHIPPGTDAMSLLEETYNKSLENEVFRASANALALAAPLKAEEDEENESTENANSSNAKETKEQSLKSLAKHNLKFQMLKSFLSVGLFWPSIYILSEYPFLAHIDKETSALMSRLFSALIDPLYRQICPVTAKEAHILLQKKQVAQITRLKLAFTDMTMTRQFCFKPTIKNVYNKEYVFFYTQWTDNLPACHTKQDLLDVSAQFLKFFGPIIALNHGNFIQLCEIVANDLSSDLSDDNKMLWLHYFRNYILPYIGHILDNSVAIDKAFSILSLYDADDRFNLYGELHQVLAKNNPYVKISFGKAEKATKDTLKRISKENVSQMMRSLARISISNPLPCFLTLIQQIESYDNLNSLVVEMAASFSRYAWDNMTLAILMRLSATGRSNMLENGLNDRRWIQSLASFIGELCQNYPDKVDLHTLLLFLVKSLHANDNSELLVWKEIVSHMGGFQAITNLTQSQVNMICCEPCLAQKVFETIDDQRYQRQESGRKLSSLLVSNNYAGELFVLLCKADKQLLSEPSLSHLKVLASRKDEIAAILHLFCSLFSFFCDQAPSLIPLCELVTKFEVSIPWAFELWRKFLGADFESDSSVAPSIFSTSLNLGLVYNFWKLELYDINYSSSLYDEQLTKLKDRLSLLQEELNRLKSSLSIKSNMSRIEESISDISDQKSRHERHCNSVTEYLSKKSASWFGDNKDAATRGFIEECILPRVVHSCFDAMFSARFLFKLHEIAIEGYSVLDCFKQLFESKVFFSTLFTSTPTEAENLGLFLSVVLQELDSWRSEETFNDILSTSPVKINDGEEECSFSNFKLILFDFHTHILEDVSRALEVTSYMSRINVITFLKNLVNIYPIVEDHCEEITRLIQIVSKFDSRDDLKLASAALIGHIRARESRWIHMWDFYNMDEDSKSKQEKKRELIAEEKKVEIVKKQEAVAAQARKVADENAKIKNEAYERQMSEKNSQASASSLNYSEGSSAGTRSVDRVNQSSDRGRYDRYTGGENEKKGAKLNQTNGVPAPNESSKNNRSARNESPVSKPNEKEAPLPKAPNLPHPDEKRPSGTVNKSNPPVRPAAPEGLADLFSQKLNKRDNDKVNESSLYNRSSRVADTNQGRQNATTGSQRVSRVSAPQRLPERSKESSFPARPTASGQNNSKVLQLPRTPLPPQAPPQKRTPLPPQVAPPLDRRSDNSSSGRNDNRGPGRSSGRDNGGNSGRNSDRNSDRNPGRNSDRNSERSAGRNLDRNPGRDSTRESGGDSGRNQDRSYNGRNPRTGDRDRQPSGGQRGSATENSKRTQPSRGPNNVNNQSRQNNRGTLDAQNHLTSSGSPLPPPPLPPPRQTAHSQDARHGKRSYDDNDRSRDKRRRR